MQKRGIIGLAIIGVFICLFLSFSASAQTNTASVTPSVGIGGTIHVSIDSTDYGDYVYFYKESDKTSPLVVLDLNCADKRCTQAKEFAYPLGTEFALGKYILAVYFNEEDDWFYYPFEVTTAVFYKPISTVIYGDLNADRNVNVADINALVDILLARVSMPSPGTNLFSAADVSGDGTLDMVDLNLLVDFILGKITQFPIETTQPRSYKPGETPCFDSDGLDYNSRGMVMVFGGITNYTDSCYSGNMLFEYYCNGLSATYQIYNCPNGCNNGACYYCNDSDGGKIYDVQGTAKSSATGGQFSDVCSSDSKTLSEFYCNDVFTAVDRHTCQYSCTNGKCNPLCTDSDNGANGSIKGYVIDKDGKTSWDTCEAGSLEVSEKTCGSDGSLVVTTLACVDGCADGACLHPGMCYDYDNGKNYQALGYVYDNTGTKTDDVCKDANFLTEMSCGANNELVRTDSACGTGYACSGGRCVPSGEAPSCSDSDNGQDFGIKGDAAMHYYCPPGARCKPLALIPDSCSGNVLTELYCNNSEVASTTQTCTYGCTDGKCDSKPDIPVYGDVNHDGVFDSADVDYLNGVLLGADSMPAFNSYEFTAANVNGDERIDSEDALLLSQRLSGDTTKFPVEEGAVPPANLAPVANFISSNTLKNTAVAIALLCADAEGDSLTYSIETPSSHGTTAISGNTATYTPAANYFGQDSFTYQCNDGVFDSNTAKVSITIGATPPSLITPVYGDINNDGIFSYKDINYISDVFRGALPMPSSDSYEFTAADVNGDGKIDRSDSILFYRRFFGTDTQESTTLYFMREQQPYAAIAKFPVELSLPKADFGTVKSSDGLRTIILGDMDLNGEVDLVDFEAMNIFLASYGTYQRLYSGAVYEPKGFTGNILGGTSLDSYDTNILNDYILDPNLPKPILPGSDRFIAADINQDGKINAADLKLMVPFFKNYPFVLPASIPLTGYRPNYKVEYQLCSQTADCDAASAGYSHSSQLFRYIWNRDIQPQCNIRASDSYCVYDERWKDSADCYLNGQVACASGPSCGGVPFVSQKALYEQGYSTYAGTDYRMYFPYTAQSPPGFWAVPTLEGSYISGCTATCQDYPADWPEERTRCKDENILEDKDACGVWHTKVDCSILIDQWGTQTQTGKKCVINETSGEAQCDIPPRCESDSDDGLSYDVWGHTTDSNEKETWDDCIDADTLSEKSCGADHKIVETEYPCPYGCDEGVCISLEPNCTDSDDDGSNGGLDYETFGSAVDINEIEVNDSCLDDYVLLEGACNEFGEVETLEIVCDNGCFEGECLPNVPTCTDSDAVESSPGSTITGSVIESSADSEDDGLDYYELGSVTDEEGVVTYDECSGDVLSECSCGADKNVEKTEYTCTYGCFNGECLTDSIDIQSAAKTCSDSDGGGLPLNKGTCTDAEGAFEDSCDSSGSYVNEFFCGDGFCDAEVRSCANGCSDGECIDWKCDGPEGRYKIRYENGVERERVDCKATNENGYCYSDETGLAECREFFPASSCQWDSDGNSFLISVDKSTGDVTEGMPCASGQVCCPSGATASCKQSMMSESIVYQGTPQEKKLCANDPCSGGGEMYWYVPSDKNCFYQPEELKAEYSIEPLKFTTLHEGPYKYINPSTAWGGGGKRVPGEMYYGADPESFIDEKIQDYFNSSFYTNPNEYKIIADGDSLLCQADVALSKVADGTMPDSIRVRASVRFTVGENRSINYTAPVDVPCTLETINNPASSGSFDVYKCQFRDRNGNYAREAAVDGTLRGKKIICDMSIIAEGQYLDSWISIANPLQEDNLLEQQGIRIFSAPVVVANYTFYYINGNKPWTSIIEAAKGITDSLPELKFDLKKGSYIKNVYSSDIVNFYPFTPEELQGITNPANAFSTDDLRQKLINILNSQTSNKFDYFRDTIVYASSDSVRRYNLQNKINDVGFYIIDSPVIVLKYFNKPEDTKVFLDEFANRAGSPCSEDFASYRSPGPIDLFPRLKKYACTSVEVQQDYFDKFKTDSSGLLALDSAFSDFNTLIDALKSSIPPQILRQTIGGLGQDPRDTAYESNLRELEGKAQEKLSSISANKKYMSIDYVNAKYAEYDEDDLLEYLTDRKKAAYYAYDALPIEHNAYEGMRYQYEMQVLEPQKEAIKDYATLSIILKGQQNLRLAASLQEAINAEKERRASEALDKPYPLSFEVKVYGINPGYVFAGETSDSVKLAKYTFGFESLGGENLGYGAYVVTQTGGSYVESSRDFIFRGGERRWVAYINKNGEQGNLYEVVDWSKMNLQMNYDPNNNPEVRNFLQDGSAITDIFITGTTLYLEYQGGGSINIGDINGNRITITVPDESLAHFDGATISGNKIILDPVKYPAGASGLQELHIKTKWANGPVYRKSEFLAQQKYSTNYGIRYFLENTYPDYSFAERDYGPIEQRWFSEAFINPQGVTADTFIAIETSARTAKTKEDLKKAEKGLALCLKDKGWTNQKADCELEFEVEVEVLKSRIEALESLGVSLSTNPNLDSKLKAEFVANNIQNQIDYQIARERAYMNTGVNTGSGYSRVKSFFNLGIAKWARIVSGKAQDESDMLYSELDRASRIESAIRSYSYSGYNGLSVKEKDLLRTHGIVDSTGKFLGNPTVKDLWGGSEKVLQEDPLDQYITWGLPKELLVMYATGGTLSWLKATKVASSGRLFVSEVGLYGNKLFPGVANPALKGAVLSEAEALRAGSYLQRASQPSTIGALGKEALQFMAIQKSYNFIIEGGLASFVDSSGEGIFLDSSESGLIWHTSAPKAAFDAVLDLPVEFLQNVGMFGALKAASPLLKGASELKALAIENAVLSSYGITFEVGKAALSGQNIDINKVGFDTVANNLLFTMGMKGIHGVQSFEAKTAAKQLKNAFEAIKEKTRRTDLSDIEKKVKDAESATENYASSAIGMRNAADAKTVKAMDAKIKELEAGAGDPSVEAKLEALRAIKSAFEEGLRAKEPIAKIEGLNGEIENARKSGNLRLAEKKIREALNQRRALLNAMQTDASSFEAFEFAAFKVENMKLDLNLKELNLVKQKANLASAVSEKTRASIQRKIDSIKKEMDVKQAIMLEAQKELANVNREYLERTYGKKYVEILEELNLLWAREVEKLDAAKAKEIRDRIDALREENLRLEQEAAVRAETERLRGVDIEVKNLLTNAVNEKRAFEILADDRVQTALKDYGALFKEALRNPRVVLRAEAFADYILTNPSSSAATAQAVIKGFADYLGTRRIVRGIVMTPDEKAVISEVGLLEKGTRDAIAGTGGKITADMLENRQRIDNIIASRDAELASDAGFAQQLANHAGVRAGGIADPFQSFSDEAYKDVAISVPITSRAAALSPEQFVYVFTADVPVFDTVPMTTGEITGKKISYFQNGPLGNRRPFAEAPGTEIVVFGNIKPEQIVGEPTRLFKREAEQVITDSKIKMNLEIAGKLKEYVISDEFKLDLTSAYEKLIQMEQDPAFTNWLNSQPANVQADIRQRIIDIKSDPSSPDELAKSADKTDESVGGLIKRTYSLKKDWSKIYLNKGDAVKLTQRIDELLVEYEVKRAVNEAYRIPSEQPRVENDVKVAKEKVKMPNAETETEFTQGNNKEPLADSNSPGAFGSEINDGKRRAAAAEKARKSAPGTQDYADAINELKRLATLDKSGALVLPLFEVNLHRGEYADGYTLYEFSITRNDMKELNTGKDGNYEKGTAAIKVQHNLLIQFAEQNGLLVSSLQKTGFLAVPNGKSISAEQIATLRNNMKEAIKAKVGKDIPVRVGIAEAGAGEGLMQTALHTRRSLIYNSLYETENGRLYEYGETDTSGEKPVQHWYSNMGVETAATANDIFKGYYVVVESKYRELDKLNVNSREYREALIELAQIELADASFSSRVVVKNYMSNPETGVRENDLVMEIDGVKVGEKNRADIIELTRLLDRGEITESELAQRAGMTVDGNIIEVSRAVRQMHDRAVDNVRSASTGTISEYNKIAQKAGYGDVVDLASLKSFLKWEFKNRGRFRGGDELFITVRKEVAYFNPGFEKLVKDAVARCDFCDYGVRIGSKIVKGGESYLDSVKDADYAVKLSKDAWDTTVVIDKEGKIRYPDNLIELPATDVGDAFNNLRAPDANLRIEAIKSLVIANEPSTFESIRNSLADLDANVRIKAAEALGTLKDSGSVQSLRELKARETNVYVVEAANNAILQITASDSAETVTPEELAKRWGSRTEIILPIGDYDYTEQSISMNPEKTVYDDNGKPVSVIAVPGDKIKLKRFLHGRDEQTTLKSFQEETYGTSFEVFEMQGDLEAAKQVFEDTRGLPPTLENILKKAWDTGKTGNLGVASEYQGEWKVVGYSEPNKYRWEMLIEVPAERIIPVQEVNGRIVFPEGFDVNRPDIAKFAFLNPNGYEAEITFLYEIPKEYIKKAGICPMKPAEVEAQPPSQLGYSILVFGRFFSLAVFLVAAINGRKKIRAFAAEGISFLPQCLQLQKYH